METAFNAMSSAFSALEFEFFNIPLYVILIGIAVVGGIFKLLSNKKNGGE